jgi:hypothetical protein
MMVQLAAQLNFVSLRTSNPRVQVLLEQSMRTVAVILKLRSSEANGK